MKMLCHITIWNRMLACNKRLDMKIVKKVQLNMATNVFISSLLTPSHDYTFHSHSNVIMLDYNILFWHYCDHQRNINGCLKLNQLCHFLDSLELNWKQIWHEHCSFISSLALHETQKKCKSFLRTNQRFCFIWFLIMVIEYWLY